MLNPRLPNSSISSGVIPTTASPSIIPTVAGTPPCSRMIASTFNAVSTFCGYGIPCEIIVDSRAITGLCSASAFDTSSFVLTFIMFSPLSSYLKS